MEEIKNLKRECLFEENEEDIYYHSINNNIENNNNNYEYIKIKKGIEIDFDNDDVYIKKLGPNNNYKYIKIQWGKVL
jgi:histidinol phosphatase-like PHP family hydrolase